MSDPIALTEEQMKDIPSTEQAANDLRQAAGIKSREIAQSAEERAQLLKDSAAQKAQKLRDFAGEKASQFADVAGEKASQFKDVAGEHWGERPIAEYGGLFALAFGAHQLANSHKTAGVVLAWDVFGE